MYVCIKIHACVNFNKLKFYKDFLVLVASRSATWC